MRSSSNGSTWRPNGRRTFYVELPFAVVAVGSYHQFGAFVRAIAALPRVVTLHDFEIAPGDVGLRLSLAAKTYSFSSEVDGTRASGPTPGPVSIDAHASAGKPGVRRSPFELARTAPAAQLDGIGRVKGPLERFAVDRLQMVGTLGRDGTAYALLRDPNGHVHRVSANDFLGLSGGQVTSINATRLEFMEVVDDGAGGWLTQWRTIELQGATASEEDTKEEK